MNALTPLPRRAGALAELHSVQTFARLLIQRQIHMPADRVGRRLRFANGTNARVYRETVVDRGPTEEPCVLVVAFRLRYLRGFGHTLFRWESMLNTPLFVGFPGYVSKLWLAHDENNVYRGVYEWDGAEQAEAYARALWQVLAIGSVPGTIAYRVLPDLHRDDVLDNPHLLDTFEPDDARAWWRLTDRIPSTKQSL